MTTIVNEPSPSDDELRTALAVAEQRVIDAEKAYREIKPQYDAVWGRVRVCHDDMEVLLKEMRQRMGGPNRYAFMRIPMPGEAKPHKQISVLVGGRKPGRKRLMETFHRLCGPRRAQDVPLLKSDAA